MSENRTIVKARWPFTPLGVSVEIAVPETYELSDYAAAPINELVGELWKGTPTGRLVRAFADFLSQPVITIKAVFTRG